MKLLLVYPQVDIPGLSKEIIMVEPLSLEYLAAVVAEEHDVRILDLRIPGQDVRDVMSSWTPDVVGITGFTLHAPEMVSLSVLTKEVCPDIKVIVGGHHATFMPSSFMVPSVDIIARGEGESVFSDILNSAHSTSGLSNIPGLIYRDDGEWLENQGMPQSSFLGVTPAHHMVNQYSNHYHILKVKCLTVQFSRGCPYNCSFCDCHKFYGGRYRVRNVDDIIQEIDDSPARLVYIPDDNVGVNRPHLASFVSRFAAGGNKKRFAVTMGAREILSNMDILDRWFKNGLSSVFLGVERIKDEQIADLGKRVKVNQNNYAIDYIHSRGGIVIASFIILPTDIVDDFMELEDYVRSRGVDIPFFCILTPFPGTDIWDSYHGKDTDFSKYDLAHAVIPTTLPKEVFSSRFAHLYSTVSKRRLLLKMVRHAGWRWLFRLPSLMSEVGKLRQQLEGE